MWFLLRKGYTCGGHLLGLVLIELVKLLAKLSNGVIVLLAQIGHGLLMLNVGLFEVAAQLGQLGLAALVQLDLSGSRTTSFLKSLAQLLDFTGKVGTLLLSLGASLTLGLQFLLELLDASLDDK